MIKKQGLSLIILILLLAACAAENSAEKFDYEQTKKMVVDILKTDEGKKALQEVMDDEKMQERLIMDQAVVKETIENALTSEKGVEFWKKAFEDPNFAESFAKSMQKEYEALHKKLMKDPEYQSLMLDILKDPELMKEVTDLLKSKEFREHIQTIMTETFESPIYQKKIQDILLKAAEKKASDEEEEKKKDEYNAS